MVVLMQVSQLHQDIEAAGINHNKAGINHNDVFGDISGRSNNMSSNWSRPENNETNIALMVCLVPLDERKRER